MHACFYMLSRISIVIISGKSVRIVNYTEVSMQETAKEEGEHPMVYVSDIYIYIYIIIIYCMFSFCACICVSMCMITLCMYVLDIICMYVLYCMRAVYTHWSQYVHGACVCVCVCVHISHT